MPNAEGMWYAFRLFRPEEKRYRCGIYSGPVIETHNEIVKAKEIIKESA